MSDDLLTPRDVEIILCFPRGRAVKMARNGDIPHITLPTVGKERAEIRFIRSQVDEWLAAGCPAVEPETCSTTSGPTR